ncbi:outer membrane receptor for ferrienterochelin and colicins [Pseudaminobacter salicylatoxidans]|uniref:Outer membrane receptor for ferrienterochelin and colicins n=1 Tax=Pseudaminobacter salicylatoxidans TaxID=93369 RepID=A0A316CWJ5_PSESE|nr:TonB-dependent receptor [Pseudaminobacter salicylatoxidans]PWJ86464.1 outer membrane receptor for ferrienterochelin and colicins [Pseudaminobacter salicylatoxidans]
MNGISGLLPGGLTGLHGTQTGLKRLLSAGLVGTALVSTLVAIPSRAFAQSAEESAGQQKRDGDAAESGTMTLGTIVVTATGFEQNVTDAPASITVVPREQLEKGSYRDLTDALRDIQGVAVTGIAGEQDIFIRGLPGSYTLLLVDGKRQNTRDARTNGNAGFEQSFLPPLSAIDRIEVVRGPMSSLYGSDAMGGVINIITRKVADRWTGSVTLDGTLQQHSDYGNSGQAAFYASGPFIPELLGLQVWGRGLKRGEDSFIAGTPEWRDTDITARLTLTPNEDHDITLEAGHTRLRRNTTVGNTIDPVPTQSSKPVDRYNYNDRDHWSLSHTGRWGWTTSEFSILQEWAKRTNFNWDDNESRFVENLRSPEIRNTIIDGKFTTPFELLGRHTLVTGGQFSEGNLTDQNPGRRTGLDEQFNIKQWALFAEDEWWITPDFALTGGIRMDDHEIYGSHFSPRGYAVWHATDQITLKGGVSTGFRAPEIRTIAPGYAYTTGGGNCASQGTCGVIIGDPNLRPETSTSYEASVLWDSLAGFRAGATYFYTDFKDKIANERVYNDDGTVARWSEDPYYQLWHSYNIDNAVMQGVELTADWEVTDDITLRGNYTYTHSRQKTGDFIGFPLARTPEHMANLRADWRTPYDGLTAWAAANYHGSEINAGQRLGTAGRPIAYSPDGKTVLARKYDAYTTFDIGASYDFNENVTLNAAVYNMFDKRAEVDELNAVVEGRRFWVSLTSRF